VQIRIRKARRGDAQRLAELVAQLGYPTTKLQMAKRLSLVLQEKKGVCFVAQKQQDGEIVGWVHVSTLPLLEVERRAEVNGLVVEENTRSQGAGRVLLGAAERWARKMGAKSMSVRSNVIRERAHAFYERNGYQHYKTQKAFRKEL
jgi:N-acetylglutamate synthase-like GNAT family acetyltransferase